MMPGRSNEAQSRRFRTLDDSTHRIDGGARGQPRDIRRLRAHHGIHFNATASGCCELSKVLQVDLWVDTAQIVLRGGDAVALDCLTDQISACEEFCDGLQTRRAFGVLTCLVIQKTWVGIQKCHRSGSNGKQGGASGIVSNSRADGRA